MTDENVAQAFGQGNGIKICEIKLGSACTTKPIADTLDLPEPDFEEIKHLCSDKPIRFNKASRQV
ncbi:MAG: hypothetical protein ACYTFW_12205 [Planctomycetota bacterium]|jgi:hypothetical protein